MNMPARRSTLGAWLLVCVPVVAASPGAPALAATSGANGTHDPSRMIESEGRLYVFSTGASSKSSADGLAWTAGPRFLNAIPAGLGLPDNQGVWAPDVISLGGQYYLYYSAAASSTRACAIGLLTSPTLNPSSPGYRWTDRGLVVSNGDRDTYCAIDPAPVLDADGNLWVVWGGGYTNATTAQSIWLTRLDNATGLASPADTSRPGHPLQLGHKEGPYIHLHAGTYYLFWQTGGCCDGASSTYTMHVARAQAITGPYGPERTFYSSRGSIHGPGHIGIYAACGVERFTYHYYPDTGGSVLGENELTWSADGWPVVGPESSAPIRPCGGGGSGGAGGARDAGTAADAGGTGDARADAGRDGAQGGRGDDAGAGAGSAGGAGAGGRAGDTGAGGSGAAGSGGVGGSSGAGGTAGGAGGMTGGAGGTTGGSGGGAAGCSCAVRGGPTSAGDAGSWILWWLGVLVTLAARSRRVPASLVAVVLGAAVVSTGCVGAIGDPGASPAGGGGPGGPAGGGAGGASGAAGSTTPLPAFAPSPGAYKRLTASSFRNSLNDLLGPVTVGDLEQDSWEIGGLATVGMSRLSISELGVEQYQAAVDAATTQVFADPARRDALIGCVPTSAQDADCFRRFVTRFGRLAFRQPLTPAQIDRYTALVTTVSATLGDVHEGLRAGASGLLLSPYFLYRLERGAPAPAAAAGAFWQYTSGETAARLSYFLTNTTPDPTLLDLADQDGLQTAAAVRAQAERLLSAEKGRRSVGNFATELFQLEIIASRAKDPKLFPQYTPALQAGMMREIPAMFEALVLDQRGSALELFTTRSTFVNQELAALYGLPATALTAQAMVPAALPAGGPRAGLLGTAGFLSLYASQKEGSPTQRGKFIREIVLCQEIPPPPPDVNTMLADPPAGVTLTKRQRLQQHETNKTCATCHLAMDPLGLALENFDAVGQLRATDQGLPIDASGSLDGTAFDGAVELGRLLAGSPDAARCMVRSLYRYGTGHVETPSEAAVLADLGKRFHDGGYQLRELMLDLVASDGFRYVAPPAP